jgi:methylated-DNA-protein-cysteine methyltransferase-like protein
LISIITSRAIWYSRKHITWKEVIAAATAANIVHMSIRTSPKKKGPPSSPAAGRKAQADKPAKKEPTGFSFFSRVYELVRQVPKGRVTTYGAIAEASGLKLTARMVGWAMYAAGSAKPKVPAHRVVNSKGILSGKDHFSTPTLMEELLAQEGITVKGDKIEQFKTLFWDPAEGKKKKAKLKK